MRLKYIILISLTALILGLFLYDFDSSEVKYSLPRTNKDTLDVLDIVAWEDGFQESDSTMLLDFYGGYKGQVYLVIHTDATYKGREFNSPEDINNFFKKHRGWKNPGYIEWLDRNGVWHQLKSFNIDCKIEPWEISNGAKGFNSIAVHLAYSSSLVKGQESEDTRSEGQIRALKDRIRLYKSICPNVKVVGHRDLSPDINGDGKITSIDWVKTCPNFDVKDFVENL